MKKFVILTTQRSGSTVLWRFLDLHPEIEAHGEMFLSSLNRHDSYSTFIKKYSFGRLKSFLNRRRMIGLYMERLFSNKSEVKAIGFKLMYNQNNKIITDYINTNNLYVIHLIRRNFLKILLSRETASKRNLYHATNSGEISPTRIHLDSADIIEKLYEIKKDVVNNRSSFKSLQYLEVFYEDLVTNKDETTNTIFDFLGVSHEGISDMAFPLKKINSDNVADLIENFDEIQSIIEESEFHEFLN